MPGTPLRVVIAGGGTAGHVFPAMALAEALLRRAPDNQRQVLFVGSEGGLEADLIPRHGYPMELLRVGKLKGSAWKVRARTLAGLPLALGAALGILHRFKPHVVVGVGGYASAPVVMAASMLRRPVVLLEQNAIPGVTNRVLSRLARHVATSFGHAQGFFPPGKALLLGNPIRAEVSAALLARTGAEEKAAAGEPPCLLVLGGSQGARPVNELVCGALPGLLQEMPGLQVIHQTGPADLERVTARYRELGVTARVEAFFHDMVQAYEPAWLMVGRSGASTISELTLAGLPALLIPYPFAADDHQAKNAQEVSEAGGSLVIPQGELTPEILADRVSRLLSDPARLGQMGRAMRAMARPEAADDVARLVEDLASGARCSLV